MWTTERFGGIEYHFTHLNPFTISVTPKAPSAPTFKALVTFGCHTFTREWSDIEQPDLRYDDGQEVRCFCPIRHEQSKNLPSIIRRSTGGQAYFSQNHNYLFFENLPGLTYPYVVFFNMAPAANIPGIHARMFIVSAYEKENFRPAKGLKSISFATLVAKTARRERIRRP